MTIKIGDICHIQDYYGHVWIGEVMDLFSDYRSKLIYIRGCDRRDPQFAARFANELSMIDGEWWEKN